MASINVIVQQSHTMVAHSSNKGSQMWNQLFALLTWGHRSGVGGAAGRPAGNAPTVSPCCC